MIVELKVNVGMQIEGKEEEKYLDKNLSSKFIKI